MSIRFKWNFENSRKLENKQHTIAIILNGDEKSMTYITSVPFGPTLESLGYKVVFHHALTIFSKEQIEKLIDDKSITIIYDFNFYLIRNHPEVYENRKDVLFIEWVDTLYNKVDELRLFIRNNFLIFLVDKAQIPYATEVAGTQFADRFHFLPSTYYNCYLESNKKFNERKYDLIFIGRLGIEQHDFSGFNFIEKRIAKKLIEKFFLPTSERIDLYADKLLKKYRKIGLYKKDIKGVDFGKFIWKVIHIIRTKRRLQVIHQLSQLKGRKILIITDSISDTKVSWTGVDLAVLPFQPWTKVTEYLGDSKILVNVMPFHIDSIHEKTLTAMKMGCMVVSDRSICTEENFKNEEDIFFFDYDNHSVVDIVNRIMSDDFDNDKIIENARFKTENYQHPLQLAEKMDEKIKKYFETHS